MGGRGAAGSTTGGGGNAVRDRSLFQPNLNQGAINTGSGKSGGANQRNKSGTTAKSGTGGVQNGGSAGGQNKGDTGVTSTVSERDVVVERPKIPADADLNALFEESDIFEEFMDKYAGESDVQFRRQYPIYFGRWRATVDVEEDRPASGDWRDSLPKAVRPPNEDPLAIIFDDAEKVNRPYEVSAAHRVNCTRTATALELNMQGYDVKAVGVNEGYLPRVWREREKDYDPNTGATWKQIAQMWRTETGAIPKWFVKNSPTGDRQAVVDAMEQEILSWGEGARGFVGVKWRNKASHIFNVIVKDGRVVYIDSQPVRSGGENGEIELRFDSDWWKSGFDPKEVQRVMRVDNLIPTDKVGTWVTTRGSAESNVMSKADFFDEFNRRWLNDKDFWGIDIDSLLDDPDYQDDPDLLFADLYSALFYGWEAVWRGDKNPSPPRSLASEPVFVEMFERGVELAEVPI